MFNTTRRSQVAPEPESVKMESPKLEEKQKKLKTASEIDLEELEEYLKQAEQMRQAIEQRKLDNNSKPVSEWSGSLNTQSSRSSSSASE